MTGENKIIWLLLVGVLFFQPVVPTWAQQETGQLYIVQRDDTLFKIAEKYLGNGYLYPEITAATNAKHAQDPTYAAIADPDIIQIGAMLWIPTDIAGSAPSAPHDAAPVQPVQATAQPAGHIAFSFWNNSPERCTYEINIIDAAACAIGSTECQASRQIYPLNNASEPALSPAGSRLAFRGWGAYPEKYNENRVDHPYYGCTGPFAERMLGHTTPDGTDYSRVAGFWEDSHPDWSPDGNRILFDTGRNGDGITRIMAASADGQREETLRLAGQQPSWAPDNDRFVFRGCDTTGNRCGLWLARALPVEAWDLGLNLLAPVLQEPEAAHPDWSPVTDQIVYQSPASGNWDLYVINADGTGKQQLTSAPGSEGLPAWSPDGQWVAYLSDVGGSWGIWVIRADGSQSRQLFAFDGGTFTPLAVPPFGARSWLDEQISWAR